MTSFIVILLLLLPGGSKCGCHPVKANQTSYGANEFILVDGFKVSEISGKVLLGDGADPVVDAIVEVFEYSNSGADYKDVDRALAKKRRAACATGNDGGFCFSNIPSGRYLLRAGTGKSSGINQIHAIITVLPKNQKAPTGPTGKIELSLSLGT